MEPHLAYHLNLVHRCGVRLDQPPPLSMISDFRAKEHDGEGARLHHDGGRGHRGRGSGGGGVLAFSRKAA